MEITIVMGRMMKSRVGSWIKSTCRSENFNNQHCRAFSSKITTSEQTVSSSKSPATSLDSEKEYSKIGNSNDNNKGGARSVNIIEKLLTSQNQQELNNNLLTICNQSDITEERLTAVLYQNNIIQKFGPSSLLILMQFYAKKGNAPKVKELFQLIANPDDDMKKSLVHLLALAGSSLKSKSTTQGSLNPKTATNLMKSIPSNLQIAHKRSISELKEVEDALKKKKDCVSYTHSVVIDAMALRGSMTQAEKYFQDIQHVNTEVLNSMMDGWIRMLKTSDTQDGAQLRLVKERVQYYFNLFDIYKVNRDSRTYVYLLKCQFLELQVEGKAETMNSIHESIERMVKTDRIVPDSYFISTFIARLSTIPAKAKIKKLYYIYKNFLGKATQSDTSKLSLLQILAGAKCIPEALSLFEQVKNNSSSPQRTQYYDTMITMFIESSDFEPAFVLFEEMVRKKIPRSENTYLSLISHFSKLSDHKTVTKFYDAMVKEGIKPNEEILGHVITSLMYTKSKEEALKIVQLAEQENKITSSNCTSFIRAYGYLGALERAESVFKMFKDTKQLRVYNEMLYTYVWLLCVEDAITLYLNFPMKGDIFTYETLIEALGMVREYDAILDTHQIMLQLNIIPSYKYYDQLISILTKETPSESVKQFLGTLPTEMSRFKIENVEQLILKILF
ncbi:hypothetical protein C9374_009106 [Naegleria lovaniensis]|uniref:Pentacotripeptide-repeat region of PRORP domain-containing protein n=2 Tax=Naegleria lovaniensis TaxID=51637 RepID=A0AA88KF88_NAELO|nr:uncharacterized protein C9374_009106 [Naegleria lovaniensis]KAG2377590.1 hypothetical protein C9374_009106 [Naegleria lovaniensis]